MSNLPTVKIHIHFKQVFKAIDEGTVYCKDNFVLIGDKFISYENAHDSKEIIIVESEKTEPPTPPTIKLVKAGSKVNFKIAPGSLSADQIFFDWFEDPVLTPLKVGVNSNVIRYQLPAKIVDPYSLDVTMTIVVVHNGQEYTIGWDPIIEVDDVDTDPT